MFPLLYCEVTVVSSKQVLTGTTPLNQRFSILPYSLIFTYRMLERQMQRGY